MADNEWYEVKTLTKENARLRAELDGLREANEIMYNGQQVRIQELCNQLATCRAQLEQGGWFQACMSIAVIVAADSKKDDIVEAVRDIRDQLATERRALEWAAEKMRTMDYWSNEQVAKFTADEIRQKAMEKR